MTFLDYLTYHSNPNLIASHLYALYKGTHDFALNVYSYLSASSPLSMWRYVTFYTQSVIKNTTLDLSYRQEILAASHDFSSWLKFEYDQYTSL